MTPRPSSASSRRRSGQRRGTVRPAEHPILDLRVGEPAHGGACVARDEAGRVVFVRHALPGERVRARVNVEQKTLAWADAIEILEASEDRIPSVWDEAGPDGVGGGELAHVHPSAQLRWKTAVIEGQLRRVGGEEVASRVRDLGGVHVRPAPMDEGEDDVTGRRTRIDLMIDEHSRAGMQGYRSRRIHPLRLMPLASPAVGELGIFGDESAWRTRWNPGDRIRVVAPNGNSPVVVTHEKVWDHEGNEHRGPLTWTVAVDGQLFSYDVRPQGFWQTHVQAPEILASAVMSRIPEGTKRVMELYSGAGLFTLPMAARLGSDAQIVTLEGDEGAVADAYRNLEGRGVSAYVGDVDGEAIADMAHELGRPDIVVLDPPRSGAGLDVCRGIAQAQSEYIVLVSCDPAAGARDLRDLCAAGYEVESFEAWDLFPYTHHVECVASLRRRH